MPKTTKPKKPHPDEDPVDIQKEAEELGQEGKELQSKVQSYIEKAETWQEKHKKEIEQDRINHSLKDYIAGVNKHYPFRVGDTVEITGGKFGNPGDRGVIEDIYFHIQYDGYYVRVGDKLISKTSKNMKKVEDHAT